jgi:hypothetical protein
VSKHRRGCNGDGRKMAASASAEDVILANVGKSVYTSTGIDE